jgi:hypothetical protein
VYVKAQKAHDPDDVERWEESTVTNTLSPRDGTAVSTIVFTQNQRDEIRELGDVAASLSGEGSHQTNYLASVCLPEGSPARISQSPGNEPGSPATGPDSSSSSPELSMLFDPAGFSSRTYPVSSLATAVGTSESSLERWPTSGTAWLGGLSTHASSECRSVDGECSSWQPSLTEILEEPQNVPEKYSLSARAAAGILRRAEKRGKALPPHLRTALEALSQAHSDPSPKAPASAPPTSTESALTLPGL